ncbi:MAG: hypothetical protein WCK43_09620, partial [bacterium]
MAQTTDLFDSTDGAFADYSTSGTRINTYTTLIGGVEPDTKYWFFDDLSSRSSLENNITKIVGNIDIEPGVGIMPLGNYNSPIEFSFNQKTNLKNFVVVLNVTVGASEKDFKIGIAGRGTPNGTGG